MYSGRSKSPLGRGFLPIYENCQIIVASVKGATELEAIIDGTYERSPKTAPAKPVDANDPDAQALRQYYSSRRVLEYMLGRAKDETITRGLLRSRVRRIDKASMKVNVQFDMGPTKKTQLSVAKGAQFVACSVHMQGHAPVVALQRASIDMKSSFGPIKKGCEGESCCALLTNILVFMRTIARCFSVGV